MSLKLTFIGHVHGECGARPNVSDNVLSPDLPNAFVLEGHVEERIGDADLSSAVQDDETGAFVFELPLAFVDNIGHVAKVPSNY